LTLTEAAKQYTDLGLSVIALSGKAPNGAVHKHGLKDAIMKEDFEARQSVFTHPQTTGVGILTDTPFVVIDIDGEEGAQQWRDMLGDTALVPTKWVAKTGRGLHLWFLTPEPTGTVKLGPKLDLKGDGGYVAAPPSKHPDGHRYEWLDFMADYLPAPLPEPVVALLEQRARQQERRMVGKQQRKPVRGPRYTPGDTVFYASADFSALIKGQRDAEEGNRNNYLHWAAATLAEEGGLEEDFEELEKAALDAGLERAEVRTTLRSAIRRHGG